MPSLKRAALALTLPLLLVATTACQDDPTSPAGSDLPDALRNLETGIHPVLSIPRMSDARAGETVQIRVHLRQVGLEEAVSSFQGELLFDAAGIEVVDGAFAEGLLGAWNEVESGVVRFAGVTLEGVGDEAALVLTAKTLRPIDAGSFTVVMEEVVGGEAFTDLTDQVVLRDKALVTDHALDGAPR